MEGEHVISQIVTVSTVSTLTLEPVLAFGVNGGAVASNPFAFSFFKIDTVDTVDIGTPYGTGLSSSDICHVRDYQISEIYRRSWRHILTADERGKRTMIRSESDSKNPDMRQRVSLDPKYPVLDFVSALEGGYER